MIFNVPGHIEQIRNGLYQIFTDRNGNPTSIVKTQTRRLNRGIYKVGKDYAVQSKRGAKAEPDIRIVMDRIWHEQIARPLDLRLLPSFNVISVEDARAEGGYTPEDFEMLFRELNPKWDETEGRWAFEFHVIAVRK